MVAFTAQFSMIVDSWMQPTSPPTEKAPNPFAVTFPAAVQARTVSHLPPPQMRPIPCMPFPLEVTLALAVQFSMAPYPIPTMPPTAPIL